MHTNIHINKHTHRNAHTHIFMQTYIQTQTHTQIHSYTCRHLFVTPSPFHLRHGRKAVVSVKGKGSKSEIIHHRLLALLFVVRKVLERIIAERITDGEHLYVLCNSASAEIVPLKLSFYSCLFPGVKPRIRDAGFLRSGVVQGPAGETPLPRCEGELLASYKIASTRVTLEFS